MSTHHPGDELLLSCATGQADAGAMAVVGAHVEGCARCRATLGLLDTVGGAWLDELDPEPLATDSLVRTLAMIDDRSPSPVTRAEAPRRAERPRLPAGVRWPKSLAGADISRWYWVGPGMHFSRVRLRHAPQANVFLLRIGAGKFLPEHHHDGIELTQVLHGAFDDGRAVFSAGDFDATDADVRHQPVVGKGECICLATVSGRVAFSSALARTMGALLGI